MSGTTITITSRITALLIASMAGLQLTAAKAAERPTLVLGIVVEGLQADYIDNLREYFTDGGFNRLMRDGVVINHADYGTSLTPLAAAAMVMTGASPSVNGIDDTYTYDVEGHRIEPVFYDAASIGNFTTETYSPRRLLVSTIADEVRMSGGGITDVYALSPDPQLAMVMGGHAANSAFWINDTNGNWSTSTFYKDVPPLIGGRNRLAPLSSRLDTVAWTPMLPVSDYPYLPDHLKHYPFRYVFAPGNSDRYAMFKQSALVNSEVTTVATELINTLGLGRRGGTDMLNLTYTVAPFDYAKLADNRLELTDSYLRLDRNLDQLFNAAERATGGNSVIFLVATPPPSTVRRDEEKWNIPHGEFSTRKAGSLLNMYLMAVYGTGEWVSGYHNGHFFLNTKLIKDSNLDAKAVRADAAAFIARMSGVREAYTIDRILAGDAGDKADALKRNTHLASAGDIYIDITPGWEIINDFGTHSVTAGNHVQRLAPATAPAFILAPDIKPTVIDTPVDVRAIAPTVARLLRIRSPNAAALPAMNLK